MEPTTIILIVIFAICGMVLLWAFKNGNNIKFKKREKKEKADKKEKFKEVLPKEKPEKEKKEKKEKIHQAVKEEKSGKVEPPTNKVMKVTKEDFKSNDIEIPKALGGEDKKAQETKKDDFNFNPDDFVLPPLKDFKEADFKFDDDLLKADFPAFDSSMQDFNFPMAGDNSFQGLPFLPSAESDSFDFSAQDPFLPSMDSAIELGPKNPTVSPVKGEILTESVEDRISKVFGGTTLDASGVKEVMVSEVLTGNRSRTNRELRERRKKWMK